MTGRKALTALAVISTAILLSACAKDTATSSADETVSQYSTEQYVPINPQEISEPEPEEIDWSAVPVIAETELAFKDNDDGTVTVTDYLGTETVLNYPSEINGKPISDIEPPENCTAVKLPDSMTALGYGMFQERTKLETVVIPDSVIYIGDNVFSGCNSLKSVTLPKKLKYLGRLAFYKCRKLKEANVPEGVTMLNGNVFGQCWELEKVTLPDGLETIVMYAFEDCRSLKSLDLPDSVKTIRKNAFILCCEEITINYKGRAYTAKTIEELYDKPLDKM